MPQLYESLGVIGSFPPEPQEGHLRYWLEVQKRAGVDYPCVQGEMIAMFLDHVEGLEKSNGKYVLTDAPFVEGPVQTDYLSEILSICEETGYQIAGLTIPLSGPFTLADNIIVPADLSGESEDKPLIHVKELFRAFVEDAVCTIAKEYDARFPGSIIRVDEPIAQKGGLTSQAGYGLEEGYIQEVLDEVLGKIRSATSGVHVCGDIAGTALFLYALKNARILSHDFSVDKPRNFEYYSPEMPDDKILGAGIVSSFNPRVETFEEVKEIYRRMAKRFGKERLHLHPSCGFRGFMRILRDHRYEERIQEYEQSKRGEAPERSDATVTLEEAAGIIEQKLSLLNQVRDYATNL
jgi:methionine synthase II (cobalamin-independent)